MKLDDIKKIQKELNKFEKHIKADPVFISCNFANIVKNHPQYTKTKINILKKNFFQYTLYVLYEVLKLIYDYCTNLILSKKTINKVKKDVLFISHLTNSNNIGHQDSYFRNIKNFFSKKKVITYYINHIKKKNNKSLLGKKYFLNTSIKIGFKDELKILRMQINLFLKIIKSKNIISKKIKNILLFEILKVDTKKNLRIYFHLNDLIDKCNIKYVITICEGYSHEKMIFKSCFEKKIFSVGYQNVPLINKQILINKNLKSYMPKMIWSSDKLSETTLKNYYKKKIRIENIGSTRIFQNKLITNLNANKSITCLVMPEGFISETNDMFLLIKNFIEKYKYKKFKFIFRIHPNLKNNKLHNYIKTFSKKNMQFKFSSNNMLNDIKKSNIAIYRGSSAIINCARHGLIPIYFVNKEKIEISPIGLNKFSINKINDSDDLFKCLNNTTFMKKNLRNRKHMIKFFQKKYTSVNTDILKKLEI